MTDRGAVGIGAVACGLVLAVAGAVPAAASPGGLPEPLRCRAFEPGPVRLPPGALDRVQRRLAHAPDTLGLVVTDTATNVRCVHRPTFTAASASTVKPIVVAALAAQQEAAGEWLTEDQQELARRAIVLSANRATTEMWQQIGGRRGLADYAKILDLDLVAHRAWGGTDVTPDVLNRFARLLLAGPREGLSETTRVFLLDLMRDTAPWQRWGVRRGMSESAGNKNGWYRSRDTDGWRLHSFGFMTTPVTDRTMAVMSLHNPGYYTGVRYLSRLARAVNRALDGGAGRG